MLMTSIRLNSLVSLSVGYLHLNVLLKKSSLVYCWCRHGYNQTLTRTSSQFVPHICTPSKPHLHLHLRIRPFVWCRSHVQALPIASFLATNTCRLASRVCFSQSQWFNIVWADCQHQGPPMTFPPYRLRGLRRKQRPNSQLTFSPYRPF